MEYHSHHQKCWKGHHFLHLFFFFLPSPAPSWYNFSVEKQLLLFFNTKVFCPFSKLFCYIPTLNSGDDGTTDHEVCILLMGLLI